MTASAVGVDVGGTFTDLVSVADDGTLEARKVPSTPDDQSVGVAAALRALAHGEIARLVHGTTVATNMLLERRGARIALLTTAGFEDVLWLARQDRASLYDLAAHHPAPLVTRNDVVGVRERVTPDGIELALTDIAVQEAVSAVQQLGVSVVAVCLLHSYAEPAHEECLAAALRDAMPHLAVICSSQVFPEIREYERTATTVAEGYLRPGVSAYLGNLVQRVRAEGAPSPGVMTSAGGMMTVDAACEHAAALALSGPAGGVVGAAASLRAAGFHDAVTVDIGGTSADVGLIQRGVALTEQGGRIAGVPISLPRVLVETVAAGGGSIGWMDDGGALRVGPASAGARPGPACFGFGGTRATVTDAHVVLGHIGAVPLSGGIALDAEAAHRAIGALAQELDQSPEVTARAMIETADALIARAMRRVSVERGVDPRDCVLVPFGGGGPLHACGLADSLDMHTVFVPAFAGVLSALGLAIAAERRERLVSVLRHADSLTRDDLHAVRERAAEPLGEEAAAERTTWMARARYHGQGFELDVPLLANDDGAALGARFRELHRARNGFDLERDVEVIGVRAVRSTEERALANPLDHREQTMEGPSTIMLPDATLRIADGWTACALRTGGWLLTRGAA